MSTASASDLALRAYQLAFRPELEAAIRSYDLHDGARVLDSPCGDGFYSGLFPGTYGPAPLLPRTGYQNAWNGPVPPFAPSRPDSPSNSPGPNAYRLPFRRGCNRGSAKVFGGNRVVFRRQQLSVPLLT